MFQPNIDPAYSYHNAPRIKEMQINVDSVDLFIDACRSFGGDAKEMSRSGNLATLSITYADE